MRSVLVADLIESDEAGFACSKARLVESGLPHLRPFNIGSDGVLDLREVYQVDPSEAPKGKAQLQAGDILFNNTNSAELVGKSAVVNASMTAGFSNHVTRVRLDRSRVDPVWFSFWLRKLQASGYFTANATQWVSQAAYRTSDLGKLPINLPPLADQQRIVDLLSRAEGIARLRHQAQQKAASIVPALYLDMFGDPATNSKNLPTEQLDNLCTLVRGSSPRPQGDPRFFGGPVPRLMIADITRDGTYVTPRIDSLTEEGASKSRPMKRGEVVMAVSGAVGLPAILAVDACIHDGFVGFRNLSREITPEFFYNYLAALRHFSRTQAVGATFQNLKTEQIRGWQVPRPSGPAQQRFAELTASARSIEAQQTAALGKAKAMFQALLAQAFPGERQTLESVTLRGQAVPA